MPDPERPETQMNRRTRKVPPVRPPQEPADPAPESPGSQPWLGWAAVILVGVIVLIGVALTVERLNDTPERIGAEVQLTPIVGGMVVPTSASAGDSGEPQVTVTSAGVVSATESATTAVEETVTRTSGVAVTTVTTEMAEPTETTTTTGEAPAEGAQPEPISETAPATGTALVFEVGATVQKSAGEAVVYAEPSTEAPVMDTYAPGAALTVLEPGSDFTGYPVVVDDAGWVRVRAADGLVGWTPATGLSLAE